MVGRLSGVVKLGVVTTTCRANVEAVLAASGLSDAFSAVVSKEDVQAAKPDPECYRIACARFDVAPTEAVALEDSPTGLAAARAAGLRAIAVGHRRGHGDWAGSAPYVLDLQDIDAVLSLLGLKPDRTA